MHQRAYVWTKNSSAVRQLIGTEGQHRLCALIFFSRLHFFPFFFKGRFANLQSLTFEIIWCVSVRENCHQFCCPHTHTHTPLSSSCGTPWSSDPKVMDEFCFRLISSTVILHPKHFVSEGLGLETFSCFGVELTQWIVTLQRPQATKPTFFLWSVHSPKKQSVCSTSLLHRSVTQSFWLYNTLYIDEYVD